jgi:hypothetical protein
VTSVLQPDEQLQAPELQAHTFIYASGSAVPLILGRWDPAGPPPCVATVHVTADRDRAELWRRSLADGVLPGLR